MPNSFSNVGLQRVVCAADAGFEWKNVSESRVRRLIVRVGGETAIANRLIAIRGIGIKHVGGVSANIFDRHEEVCADLLIYSQTPLVKHRKLLLLTLESGKSYLG